MKALLFGGTSEARELCRALAQKGLPATVCTATAYGAEILEGLPGITVKAGRLDAAGMARLLQEGGFDTVIDATHPFAAEVTANIRAACRGWSGRLIRLDREASPLPPGVPEPLRAGDLAEAIRLLGTTQGRVLVTTGSRDIRLFRSLDDFTTRLYIRVLPDPEGIRRCRETGFAPERIIAMQGPFSRELNAALLRQFGCSWLLTKDTGAAGGLPEKLLGAMDAGARVLVVARPSDASRQPPKAGEADSRKTPGVPADVDRPDGPDPRNSREQRLTLNQVLAFFA